MADMGSALWAAKQQLRALMKQRLMGISQESVAIQSEDLTNHGSFAAETDL
jgi:hypothetical protein